jgi:demethylmenaquinone methyltransferase/2-methoxy-6-polyprenyl-1,4-benzoquinol methylase
MIQRRIAQGAAPAGVEPGNEAEAARRIREMFGRVAPRYDLLNHLLSLRIDVHWRRALVRRVQDYLRRPTTRLMDVCCGTGDLLIALEHERRRLGATGVRPGFGSDFCRPMLTSARQKVQRARLSSELFEADALRLPLPDGSVDLITIAYGFRNLANYQRGLEEMHRLLAPGGCLAILEFSRPTWPWLAPVYEFYFRHILPRLGNAISGSEGAYSYLQRSVERFPAPDELARMMRGCGFQHVEFFPLTGGISVLHLAYR